MRIVKKMLKKNIYKVQKSKYPSQEGDYIVIHETSTIRGCNFQRVYKGNFKQCKNEKKRLQECGY